MKPYLTMEEAADTLRISRRTLQGLIKTRPFYRLAGRRKLFSQDGVAKIAKSLEAERDYPEAAMLCLDRLDGRENWSEIEIHNQALLDRHSAFLGGIYFIGAHGKIKIGFATVFRRRLPEMQTSCPMPLVLVGIKAGSCADERSIQNRFSQYRFRSEWFFMEQPLMAYIKSECLT